MEKGENFLDQFPRFKNSMNPDYDESLPLVDADGALDGPGNVATRKGTPDTKIEGLQHADSPGVSGDDSGADAASKLQRNPPLHCMNGLRFFATLWIVQCHARPSVGPRDIGTLWLANIVARGYIPVQFYVLLSGFMTSYTYGYRSDWPSAKPTFSTIQVYFFKRIKRFLPGYCVAWLAFGMAVLVARFMKHAHGASSWRSLAPVLFYHPLMLQSWIYTLGCQEWKTEELSLEPNIPAWTISSLVFCWALHPHVEYLVHRLNSAVAVLLCVIVHNTPMLVLYNRELLPAVVNHVLPSFACWDRFGFLYTFP